MAVTRDYIPADDTMSPLEHARAQRGAMIRTGANHADFIPADDHVLAKSSGVAGSDRALDAAVARAQVATEQEYERARARLKSWDTGAAIDSLNSMPLRIMQMYVIAEMAGAARQDILVNFPQPDPALVQQYAPDLTPTIAPEPEPEPAVFPEPVAVADLAEEVPDAFLCPDCDKVAASLAGLKAHIRSKHPDPPQAAE